MSERDRYELRLGENPRDRRLAEWIDWQQSEGRNAAEIIKNVLDEVITGRSALTGRELTYQGEVTGLLPDADNPVHNALLKFED